MSAAPDRVTVRGVRGDRDERADHVSGYKLIGSRPSALERERARGGGQPSGPVLARAASTATEVTGGSSRP